MKGLHTLQNSKPNNKYLSNPLVISPTQKNVTNLAERLPCAYHSGEVLTNFCKSSNCLLPLCPKCIKIHTEEHQKMGEYGQFETLGECLRQVQSAQNQVLGQIQQLLGKVEVLSQSHEFKLFSLKQQLNNAKQQLLSYIENLFGIYEVEIEKITMKNYKNFEDQLTRVYTDLSAILASEKQMRTRASTKGQEKLQFLIDSYSRSDIFPLLQAYNSELNSIGPSYIQLTTNDYQLERIKVIVKKYLDFGPQISQTIDNALQNNSRYKSLTLFGFDSNPNKTQDKGTLSSRKRERLSREQETATGQVLSYSYKSTLPEREQIANEIKERINKVSRLQSFKSPLECYSLQKSRQLRK